MKSLCIVIFLLSVIASIQAQGIDCSNIEVDGRVYNLSSFLEYGSFSAEVDYYLYAFSVCKNTKNDDDSFCGNCLEFGACQTQTESVDGELMSWCLGRYQNDIQLVNSTEDSITLTYTEGDYLNDGECYEGGDRLTSITITCNTEVITKPTKISITQPPCDSYTYKIEFSHAAGCPIGNDVPQPGTRKGLSVGSILLIIIFVTFFVYLIAGIVINATIRQQTGKDIIPNREFWADLPSLIKDGFLFIVHKIRPPSEGYTTVE